MVTPIAEVPVPKSIDFADAAGNGRSASNASKASQEIDRHTFAGLMEPSSVEAASKPASSSHASSPSLMEHMAMSHNQELRDLLQNGRDMTKAAPGLSMAEMSAFGNEFGMHMMIATIQFQIASSVGKSAGKGVETLMRNQ